MEIVDTGHAKTRNGAHYWSRTLPAMSLNSKQSLSSQKEDPEKFAELMRIAKEFLDG